MVHDIIIPGYYQPKFELPVAWFLFGIPDSSEWPPDPGVGHHRKIDHFKTGLQGAGIFISGSGGVECFDGFLVF